MQGTVRYMEDHKTQRVNSRPRMPLKVFLQWAMIDEDNKKVAII